MEEPNFWDDPEKAQLQMKELGALKDDRDTYAKLVSDVEDMETLIEMGYEDNDESIIRLNPVDLRYTVGVGFDFFLPYVKFAIEFKMAFGLLDLKVADDDYYTLSTDNLKSRTFMLSFTFEGGL